MWQKRVNWWTAEYKYPKDFKYRSGNGGAAEARPWRDSYLRQRQRHRRRAWNAPRHPEQVRATRLGSPHPLCRADAGSRRARGDAAPPTLGRRPAEPAGRGRTARRPDP